MAFSQLLFLASTHRLLGQSEKWPCRAKYQVPGFHPLHAFGNTVGWSRHQSLLSLKYSHLRGIGFQDSRSKQAPYQCCCWWLHRADGGKGKQQVRKNKRTQSRVFFYFSQTFSPVKYICYISIENATFQLVWKSVSGNAPKRTKHVSDDNGCYYWKQHLSFFFLSPTQP